VELFLKFLAVVIVGWLLLAWFSKQDGGKNP